MGFLFKDDVVRAIQFRLMFLLRAEILGIMIRESRLIKGININDEEHKTAQFADDTQMMSGGDAISFEQSINTVDKLLLLRLFYFFLPSCCECLLVALFIYYCLYYFCFVLFFGHHFIVCTY